MPLEVRVVRLLLPHLHILWSLIVLVLPKLAIRPALTMPLGRVPPAPLGLMKFTVCLSDKEVGHMIECEGCLRWSHSKCVSISATLAKNYPFICPFCTRALFQEVTSLRSEVSQLREQLAKCSVVSQSCQDQHASEHASLTPPISPNGDSGQSTSSSVNGDSRHQLVFFSTRSLL